MTASAPVTVSGPVTPNVAETDVRGSDLASQPATDLHPSQQGQVMIVGRQKIPQRGIGAAFGLIQQNLRVGHVGFSDVGDATD